MGDTKTPLTIADGEKANGNVGTANRRQVNTSCGIGQCTPKWCQPMANIKLFTASLALLVAFHGAQMTYVVSVLTTIEKAFGFPSSKSGFITSTNDIGFLITVVPVSYMASRAHKPLVIGVSGLFIGVSGLISALPYFIWGGGMEEGPASTEVQIANVTETLSPQMVMMKASLCKLRNDSYSQNGTEECAGATTEMQNRSTGAYALLVIGQIIIGIASSTLWSLGMTFIDDNVKKHVSSIYLGILFSLRTLAPILGFVLGAVFTSKPVDLKPTNLTPFDPQWVGAWWVGFVACGIIIFLAGIPLLFFPRQLPPPKENPEKQRKKEEKRKNKKTKKRPFQDSPMMMTGGGGDEKIDIKGFFPALKRLLSNRVYMCSALGTIISAFGMIGFFTFLPKYIETQFDLSASQTSMILVGTSAIPASIGGFASGFMTSKLRMGLLQLARTSLLLGVLTIGFRFIFIGLGCQVSPVRGLEDLGRYNFTEGCNVPCGCDVDTYNPVCGGDEATYFSPCHAGCTDFNLTTYQNCSCSASGTAEGGRCRKPCNMLIPFTILLTLASLVGGLNMMPGVMLILRSMEDRDKSLGLGCLMFLFAVVGIPAPIVFGVIIDGTCQLFDQKRGSCLIYDKDQLRVRVIGSSIGMASFSIFIGIYIWYYLAVKARAEKRKRRNEKSDAVVTFDGGDMVECMLERHSNV